MQTSGVDPVVIWTGTQTQVLEDTRQKPIAKHTPKNQIFEVDTVELKTNFTGLSPTH